MIEYLSSNVKLLEQMIEDGYGDADTIRRRIGKMQEWLDSPHFWSRMPTQSMLQ